MAMPNTKKRSAHRLPSSSDEEEQDRRPRKAARPAEPSSGEDESSSGEDESSSGSDESSSDEDIHAVTPANLRRRLLAVQREAEGEQQGGSEADDGQEGSEAAGNEDINGEQNSEDDDEGEDSSSSPARRGHRIDAHHLAQMESTSLYPFTIHSDSSGVTGAEFANESNANYGGQASFGIRAHLDRWNARVGYETFETVEEDGSENEDGSEQEG